MERHYFCAYFSYLAALEPYTDEEVGKIFRACMKYSKTGEEPHFAGAERFIWPMLKDQIDRDKSYYEEVCEKRRANGSLGGRPKKTEETKWFSEKPKEPKATKRTQGEGKGEGEGKEEGEEEGEYLPPLSPKGKTRRFIPPTVAEVGKYCNERNNGIDPEAFVSYYEARGWKISNNKMKDWKAAVRYWESRRTQKVVGLNEGRLDWIDKVNLDI